MLKNCKDFLQIGSSQYKINLGSYHSIYYYIYGIFLLLPGSPRGQSKAQADLRGLAVPEATAMKQILQ